MYFFLSVKVNYSIVVPFSECVGELCTLKLRELKLPTEILRITFGISYIVKVDADLHNSSRQSSLNPTSSPLGGYQIKLDQQRSQLGPDDSRDSLKPEMWKSWIIQRTGFSNADFEGNIYYIFRLYCFCIAVRTN